jgi:hypothetical protein
MNVYKPTQLVLSSFVILALSLVLKKNLSANDRLTILAILTVAMLPSLYSINCLVGGNCVVWAWYHAVILSFWCVCAALLSMQKKTTAKKTINKI